VRGKYFERVGSLKKSPSIPLIYPSYIFVQENNIGSKAGLVTLPFASLWPIVKVADKRPILLTGEISNFVSYFWLAKSDI